MSVAGGEESSSSPCIWSTLTRGFPICSAAVAYTFDVPDGDGIHRSAAALRTALVGRHLTRFAAPHLLGPAPQPGRIVERVECHGKHMEVVWDDGLVLHTNLRLSGAWHLYRNDEKWRRPESQMRVSIAVRDWIAVCFNAPVVETYREFNRTRHPGFGPAGPDLSNPDADLAVSADRLFNYPEPDSILADALLDQHVASGIGNVFRSEILWFCEIDPFARVGQLEQLDCKQIVSAAARLLRAHLADGDTNVVPSTREGLLVYGRNGQRCQRCGDTIEIRHPGGSSRPVYFCPGCQVRLHHHVPSSTIEPRAMDPHPAASKYLSELPWRRSSDPLAG
jgi:endonuclease VIII